MSLLCSWLRKGGIIELVSESPGEDIWMVPQGQNRSFKTKTKTISQGIYKFKGRSREPRLQGQFAKRRGWEKPASSGLQKENRDSY